MNRRRSLAAVFVTIAAAVGCYIFFNKNSTDSERPFATVNGYLRATYARNFNLAYDYLSSADRQVRSRQTFVSSQGSYGGFTLELAQRLAEFMQVWLIEQTGDGNRRTVKVGYRVPAPAELNDFLLNWDQYRLNALSRERQQELLTELTARNNNGKLLRIEGQETIELIEESQGWTIFLDWASGTRVLLQSKVTDADKLAVSFATTELIARSDELFLVNMTIRNPSPRPVRLAVRHLVEPSTVFDDLQLIECGLLTPTTLAAKQEKEFVMAYQLNSQTGESQKSIKLTYDFKLD